MPNPRHALGMAAEDAVADWLVACGWQVIARRVRVTGGSEVDILALDPLRTLVAIEVRARRSHRTGAAAMTADPRRVARLRRSLAGMAMAASIAHRGLRVDLVTAEPLPGAVGRWQLSRLPGID